MMSERSISAESIQAGDNLASTSQQTPDFCQNTGIIIAGTQSSSGKTLINAMLLSALRRRNIMVQPYKTGPDYIDTAYSSHYADTPAYNLDFWMMPPQEIQNLTHNHLNDSFGVVEGVMGLFDGVSPDSNEGSTWSLSGLTNWPVILVVPAAKQGRSIRAVIRGFIEEAGDQCIKGIILNKVSGDSHANYIKRALKDIGIPIVGAVPKLPDVEWPERHLGLKASQEFEPLPAERLAKYAEQYLEIDSILALPEKRKKKAKGIKGSKVNDDLFGKGKRLAIAKDEAFHFYYKANLDALEAWGFELVPFSPLYQQTLPQDIDGLIMGGGFPEVYAQQLEFNAHMRHLIRKFINDGNPCYAECGGFMYLCEGIQGLDGQRFEMAGVVPGQIHMTERLQNFGYSECDIDEKLYGYRGHEFHYSYWDHEESRANLWNVKKASGRNARMEGYKVNRLHASYLHLYFPTAKSLIKSIFS